MKRIAFRSKSSKVVAGAVAALALAGAGAALATTELSSPSARDNAIISNAAGQLGVAPSALANALTKAIDDELSSEVSAGQLSQAQANAIESRLSAGTAPIFGGFGGGGRYRGAGGFGGAVSAAATYLGLSSSQITTDLQGGKTLADIATAQGKTADGLISAIVSAEESQLQSAVSAGTLSSSQEQTIESNLQTRVSAIVNGTQPAFGGGFGGGGFGGRGGFGGFGFGGMGGAVTAAATYLGLSSSQITTDLQGGKTLADIATAQGKTADGLVSAIVSAEESQLQSAVSAGKLSSSQEQTIESNLQTRVSAIVNGTQPAFGGFHGGFRRGGFGGGGFGGGGWHGGSGGGTTTTTAIPA